MFAWTIYISFAGVAVLMLLPRDQGGRARWVALGTALAGAIAAFGGAFQYQAGSGLQTIARTRWIPSLGIDYHLAVDGISVTL
ncbi:MAG: NADH-quinone oxidoreductase subunit M, partial [Verrucomicrobia bacterium]|nr:NADH-quinone oxidoreductase subunit M [Verrucomicrobiota bacterium]